MEYFNHLDNSYEISRFKLAESRAVTKSRKTLKNDKSKEKMGILRKSQENSENLKKCQIMSFQIYKIPCFPKPLSGYKLLKTV